MTRWIPRLLIVLTLTLVAIQFVSPARTNPGTDPQRTIQGVLGSGAAAATSVIDRACRDCHSHETTWPWYSHVAPASWLIAKDVNEGRQAVNFSDWAAYPADRQQKLLADACEEVTDGEMPGLVYTLLHPDARLTKEDASAICALSSGRAVTN